MHPLKSHRYPTKFTMGPFATLALLIAISVCTPTTGGVAPVASDPAAGPAISDMKVEVKTRSDGRLEVLNAITYDPQKITRDELVATTPGLCADYDNLRVGSISDGTAKQSGSRVLLVQCL